MSAYVFDIEANGLLLACDTLWCVAAKNLDTGEKTSWEAADPEWKYVLKNASSLVGHNIVGYDLPALKKLTGFEPSKGCRIYDTMIISQVLDYRRFGSQGHSLENWGILLGCSKIDWRARAIELGLIESNSPKGAEFLAWHPDMLIYCERDVEINVKVYKYLLPSLHSLKSREPKIVPYLQAEHAVSKWAAEAHLHGWPFDLEAAHALKETLEAKMNEALEVLSDRLGMCSVIKDRAINAEGALIGAVKSPRWTKQGFYDAHTANWFGVEPISGLDDPEFNGTRGHRQILGDYCRVEFRPLLLSSVADVKVFLARHGWVPTEWNYKKDPISRKRVKTSPKITEDSLEYLGGDGKLYKEYAQASSRLSILKTWIEATDENGRLHGDCMTIGTPSMRTRHSIIVNVPSVDAAYGVAMRKLFKCLPGWKMVGCDSAGNQARGLAHYLNDAEFTHTLLNDDIHLYNAGKLIEVLNMMKILHDFTPKTFRSKAKRILYAFLFGAGGDKLWSYIFGVFDGKKGNKLKKGFTEAVPGFSELIEKLENIYGKTIQSGAGYIPSIAGNRIYVDSFHKLLVYLLQACEKATCSAAVMLTMERLEAEGIPYIPLIMMHDEEDFMVPEEYAERAAAIGKQSFKDGPKLFGIEIMDGDSKIGDTWYDVH